MTEDWDMKPEIVFSQNKFDNLIIFQNWEHESKTNALQIKFLQVCQDAHIWKIPRQLIS